VIAVACVMRRGNIYNCLKPCCITGGVWIFSRRTATPSSMDSVFVTLATKYQVVSGHSSEGAQAPRSFRQKLGDIGSYQFTKCSAE